MLYDGVDMTRVMFGENARHVPAWMYVQDLGEGAVSFVGASRVPEPGPHPLRYSSRRAHQFIVGELVVRPHIIVATDELRGSGLSSLATGDHNVRKMLRKGEVLLGDAGQIQWIRRAEQ